MLDMLSTNFCLAIINLKIDPWLNFIPYHIMVASKWIWLGSSHFPYLLFCFNVPSPEGQNDSWKKMEHILKSIIWIFNTSTY
jgi:hypothetical protein